MKGGKGRVGGETLHGTNLDDGTRDAYRVEDPAKVVRDEAYYLQ